MKKDLISRSVLIDKLEKWKLANEERGYDTAKDLVQEMIELTKEQESVGGGWIPCSERLPEVPKDFRDEKAYLATVRREDGYTFWDKLIYHEYGWYIPKDCEVLAWQEPEPYKAESEE